MSNEPKPNRTAIEKLADVVADVRAGKSARLESLYVAEIIRECRAKIIMEIRADADDEQPNEAEIQERIRQRFLKIAFVEDLTQRQGTHMPDWSAFYAQRAELERKIEARDDG